MNPRRYLLIEIEGDEEENLEPSYATFSSSIEIYGDYRTVADWTPDKKTKSDFMRKVEMQSLLMMYAKNDDPGLVEMLWEAARG